VDHPAAAANPRGCEEQPHLPRDRDSRNLTRRNLSYGVGCRRPWEHEPRPVAGLRLQPNADASSLCFASMCCTAADHNAAVHAILHEHAIQARDYYNSLQHQHPYFVAKPGLVGSADLDVARIVAAVQQGGLQ
jgi:deferrochelatase/peroxidase EfeB